MVLAHVFNFGAPVMRTCAERGLTEDDFTDTTARVIYAEARKLLDSGELTGCSELLSINSIKAGVTPAAFVEATQCRDFCGMPTLELPPICRRLRKATAMRKLALLNAQAAEAITTGDGDAVSAVISKMQEAKVESLPRATWRQTGQIEIERAKKIIAGEEDPDVRAVAWPWSTFDREFKPFRQGELCVIAAGPSHGKSSLLRQICLHAGKHGRNCAIASLEVPAGDIFNLMASAESGQSWSNLKKLHPADQKEFLRGLARVHEAKIEVSCDTSDLNNIIAWARKEHESRFLDILAIDYLGLIAQCQPQKGENKASAVGQVAAAFKRLATELGIVVLLAVQLNRNAANDEREPRLTDLKDSGDIEAHADRVILIHRPNTNKLTGTPQNTHDPVEDCPRFYVQLFQEKGRNVGTGMTSMSFNRPCARFESFQHGEMRAAI